MSEPFIAEIRIWGCNFAPRGWAFCNGQLLPIAQNTALFSLVGTTYGGDGRTTFGLPDLQGRAPVHAGRGPGLTERRLGQKGGAETHVLSAAEMPAHTHQLRASSEEADDDAPEGNVPAVSEDVPLYAEAGNLVDMQAASLAMAGSNQAHDNMQPYIALNFTIALTGTYPARS